MGSEGIRPLFFQSLFINWVNPDQIVFGNSIRELESQGPRPEQVCVNMRSERRKNALLAGPNGTIRVRPAKGMREPGGRENENAVENRAGSWVRKHQDQTL